MARKKKVEEEKPLPVYDYTVDFPITTPKSVRRAGNVGDIFHNACTCKNCGETVRSRNRRDYRSCSCGKVSVDGGSWYCRRSGDFAMMEECSIMYEDAALDIARNLDLHE